MHDKNCDWRSYQKEITPEEVAAMFDKRSEIDKKWHLTSVKKSSHRLRDLVIYYGGDVDKAWNDWLHDDWQINGVSFGYKGERTPQAYKALYLESYKTELQKVNAENAWQEEHYPNWIRNNKYDVGQGIDGGFYTDEEWDSLVARAKATGHDISDSW